MVKINNYTFGNETFKNNEAIYKSVPLNDSLNVVEMVFENNKDITDLLFAVSYIRENKPETQIELNMPYIPYSRMDREINEQIFSLKHFAKIINAMSFSKVRVYEPHSIVSRELINNLEVMPLESIIEKVCEKNHIDIIMFPDKGARTKYTEQYKHLCSKYPVIFAEKVRDLNNRGKILESKLIGAEDIELRNKKVLIIDDICVYGNTFKFASIALKEKEVKDVYLWVTHCENAVFDGPLLSEHYVSKIFTTNSIVRKEHPDVEVMVDVN